jgi:hypothetical protein
MAYSDTIPPGPPEELTANGANPSAWTNSPGFEINWKNPYDSSGIMLSLYKLGPAPVSNYDTTGSMSGNPPDSASATAEAGQMLYLWLVDSTGLMNHQHNAKVELRFDGTPPRGCKASSPPFSTSLGFTVNWTPGFDGGGSGVSGRYDVRVKDGAGAWTEWLTDYVGLSASYPGEDGHIYYFEAGARDRAGNVEVFTEIPECATIVDTTKPSIVSTYPADGDTGLVVNTDVSAQFSELMDSTTMIATNFLIAGSISGNHTFKLFYYQADSTVYLNPDVDFTADELVTVTVKGEVTDLAGNMMKADEVWSFSVGSVIDTLGPITSAANATPDSAEQIAYVVISAFVSDTGRGDNIIKTAEFFIDVPGQSGTGYPMTPLDTLWDEIGEDVTQTFDSESLGWLVGETHTIFVHGMDGPGNWGDFDTDEIVVVPDDDTLGPVFTSFTPEQWSDTLGFDIKCKITDPSWIYDDSTGSDGQGVYLLWDNDGEIIVDANEVTMSKTVGNEYCTDSIIPVQSAGVDFAYEVYAYDNDFDTEHPLDRTQGSSGLQSINIEDVRGPNTSDVAAYPNPTAGASCLLLGARASDSLFGNSLIYGAEYFIDMPGLDSTGKAMESADGLFDEIAEDVIDTLDISAWLNGTSRWVFIHSIDAYGNWGDFDSILVVVSDVSDTIPPWIAFTSPDSGEIDVALNTWIYATFTEKVDPATVTSDKILITGSVGGVYDLWMSYNHLDSTVSIRSLDDFAPLESVNVYIAAGIKDLAGNYMPTEYWWWFKTGKGPDTLAPVVDAIDVEPGVVLQGNPILLTGSISDDKGVANAEYFIDLIDISGTGYSVFPVDSFGTPSVDIFDTLYTDALSIGKHTIFLHGVDASANWGDYDSVWIFIGEEDSTSPIFDVEIDPSLAFIGDTIQITVIPNELLHPDSAVVCSVKTDDSLTCAMPLLPDSLTFLGNFSTVGFTAGEYTVKVLGYDIWSNLGFSSASCNIGTEGDFLPENMVYAWPNPAKGNSVHFHFYVNANADITVDIYNLEGKKIERLQGRGEGGRSPHQESSNAINWNIADIASDVYIFRLYAVSDETGEKASVLKKLAIVK